MTKQKAEKVAEEKVLMYNPRSKKRIMAFPGTIKKLRKLGYLAEGEEPKVPEYKQGRRRLMGHKVFSDSIAFRDEEVEKMIDLGYFVKEEDTEQEEDKNPEEEKTSDKEEKTSGKEEKPKESKK